MSSSKTRQSRESYRFARCGLALIILLSCGNDPCRYCSSECESYGELTIAPARFPLQTHTWATLLKTAGISLPACDLPLFDCEAPDLAERVQCLGETGGDPYIFEIRKIGPRHAQFEHSTSNLLVLVDFDQDCRPAEVHIPGSTPESTNTFSFSYIANDIYPESCLIVRASVQCLAARITQSEDRFLQSFEQIDTCSGLVVKSHRFGYSDEAMISIIYIDRDGNGSIDEVHEIDYVLNGPAEVRVFDASGQLERRFRPDPGAFDCCYDGDEYSCGPYREASPEPLSAPPW